MFVCFVVELRHEENGDTHNITYPKKYVTFVVATDALIVEKSKIDFIIFLDLCFFFKKNDFSCSRKLLKIYTYICAWEGERGGRGKKEVCVRGGGGETCC